MNLSMLTRAKLPGPSAFALGNIGKIQRDTLGFFRECMERYGDFVTVRVGPTQRLPDIIKQMLSRSGEPHKERNNPFSAIGT